MPDTLTGLSREVEELVRAGERDPFAAADLAARVEEFRESLPAGTSLDEGTRTRLLVRLARTVEPRTPADAAAALAVLGVTSDDADEPAP